jgi:hypothetical protein
LGLAKLFVDKLVTAKYSFNNDLIPMIVEKSNDPEIFDWAISIANKLVTNSNNIALTAKIIGAVRDNSKDPKIFEWVKAFLEKYPEVEKLIISK